MHDKVRTRSRRPDEDWLRSTDLGPACRRTGELRTKGTSISNPTVGRLHLLTFSPPFPTIYRFIDVTIGTSFRLRDRRMTAIEVPLGISVTVCNVRAVLNLGNRTGYYLQWPADMVMTTNHDDAHTKVRTFDRCH